MDFDKTMSFKVEKDSSLETRELMKKVYEALVETSHNDARNLIRKVERDELLEKMVKNYIGLEDK